MMPAATTARRAALACALVLAAGSSVLVSASSSAAVVHLTSKNYDDKVSDGNVWLVKYYAPWCGHCKRLAPTWEELAAALKDDADLKQAEEVDGKPGVRVAHVDCTTDKSVCAGQEIKGYPTLKVVHKGEAVEAYKGARDLDALKAFAVDTHRKLTSEV